MNSGRMLGENEVVQVLRERLASKLLKKILKKEDA